MPGGGSAVAPSKGRADRLPWLSQGLAKVPIAREVSTLKRKASLVFLLVPSALSFGC